MTLEHNTGEGMSVWTINDLTVADSGDILCMVPLQGITSMTPVPTTLVVLEPPSYTVADITATPDYTSAEITFTGSDEATKYKCEYKTIEEATWTTVDEVTDPACSITDLTPATTYSIRVMAGNRAEYRDDITIGEGSFTTKDNRTPEMLSDIVVTPEAYNSTTVEVSWSLGANTDKGILVESVVVVVNGAEVEVVDGEDLSVSIDLDGEAGDYVIQVYGKNAFSEEGNEMRSSVTHTVKKTTEAPTVPPKPPTEKPEVKVEPEPEADRSLQCEGKEQGYTTVVKEQTSGAEVSLKCTIAENSDLEPANITFTYDGTGSLDQNALLLQDGVEVTINDDERSKTLTIFAVNNNHKGTYKCSVGTETCEYDLIVGEEVRGTGAAATTLISTILFSVVSLLHFL